MKSIAGVSSELPVRLEEAAGGDRASKKQITGTGDNELPLSAHVVLSNDDLLIEILLRLPVISIHLFKFVSKKWLSLISAPSFTLHRSQIPNLDPPSGLFLRRPKSSFGYDFVPLDIRIPANRSPFNTSTFGYDSGKVEILQSCNGLLLCCIKPDKFYVYYSSINLFKILPQRHEPNLICVIGGMKMAFDPTKSPHYKVVHAVDTHDEHGSSIRLQTYSSETGNWSVCNDRFPIQSFTGFYHGIYWNNSIHWLDIANGALHYKLDVEREPPLLTSIQTPGSMDGKTHYDYKLFESRGSLLLVYMVHTQFRQLNIYELRTGYSDWSMKYLVNLDDVMMLFPENLRMCNKPFCFIVRCIDLGEREEDSFLVMQVFGKVVEYKIMLKTLREICNLGSINGPVIEPVKFGCFPFIACFAGV